MHLNIFKSNILEILEIRLTLYTLEDLESLELFQKLALKNFKNLFDKTELLFCLNEVISVPEDLL